LGDAGPLTGLRLAQVRAAAGPWQCGDLLGPVRFADRHGIDVLVGIYLVCDEQGQLIYVGQARRNGGVLARLDGHAVERAKLDAFSDVWVLHLHDRTDQQTLDAIEGRIADELQLRGRLLTDRGRARSWPSAARWPELVAGEAARTRADQVAD
jgi:hypothetical protein